VAAASVALTLGLVGGCGDEAGDAPVTMCFADGLLGPNGESYGRSAEHGCRFVDEDGNLVTRLRNGDPLCYDGSLAVVPCE
jgi:hypothetical protein